MGNNATKSKPNERRSSLDVDVFGAVTKRFEALQAPANESAFEKLSANCLEAKFRPIVFKCICSLGKETDKMTSAGFIRFAELSLGDYDEKSEAIIKMRQPLRSVVEGTVASFLMCEGHSEDLRSATLLTNYIMECAPSEPLQVADLSKWLMRYALFSVIWERVFKMLLSGLDKKMLPPVQGKTILSAAAQCLITSMLPLESSQAWKLLFSSHVHGESFTKMLNAVNGRGACVVVVETSDGKVFGGFASDGFTCGPSHTGDTRCFLFEDRSRVAIYNATGFNTDFAYLNYQQQTFPNGLGIGGTDGHWSFFLDEEFGKGTSSANISTFEKCWLAGEDQFTVKTVEVWLIGAAKMRRRYDSEGNEIIQKEISALDRDPETTAVLEMSGKHMHSDGLREPPPPVDED